MNRDSVLFRRATVRDAAVLADFAARTFAETFGASREHNPRAIAFYRKCGFVDVGDTVFYVGPDRQIDRVLVAGVSVPGASVAPGGATKSRQSG